MRNKTQQGSAPHRRLIHALLTVDQRLLPFADWLGVLAVLRILEYAGRLTVLVAVIFYFTEAPERRKQAHYQAWQLINSAQGRTGSAGRIDALQDLSSDGISLAGLSARRAYLANINLVNADLDDANLTSANLQKAKLRGWYP